MIRPGTRVDRRRFLSLTAMAAASVALRFARSREVDARGSTAGLAMPATTELDDAIPTKLEELSTPGSTFERCPARPSIGILGVGRLRVAGHHQGDLRPEQPLP